MFHLIVATSLVDIYLSLSEVRARQLCCSAPHRKSVYRIVAISLRLHLSMLSAVRERRQYQWRAAYECERTPAMLEALAPEEVPFRFMPLAFPY